MTTLFTEPGLTIPTETATQMAATKLRESIRGNVNDRDARELEALQGIGFALLGILERLDATAREPAPVAPSRGRRHFRRTAS